jgi:hypothetical protein
MWPRRADEQAFHGPAGEYVLDIESQTEGDPHAILSIILTGFSNVIGRGPYAAVGRTQHRLNLNVMNVGQTAVGRKGTARGEAMYVLRDIDPTWPRPANGLSSGEGLIEAVRDPVEGIPVKSRKQFTKPSTKIVDPGVADKRLFVFESEFGSVLHRMKRDGNSLSSVIRQAWDGEDILRTMTRHSRLTATNAHISIVGQITQEELNALLHDTDLFNGFANRFLWICTRGSRHLLPDGGRPHLPTLLRHRAAIEAAVRNARLVTEIARTRAAERLWSERYPLLRAARPGTFGAATGRADPQVVRLSCLYALLDRSRRVEVKHLTAALAFWKYCEESARFLFNASTGNRLADQLLAKVRERGSRGMTRYEIRRETFAGHITATELTAALVRLRDGGYVTITNEVTAGRPRDRVRAR